MRAFLLTTVLTLALSGTAHALTFKKGEVLGPDGEIYHGASPKEMEALIEKAKNGDIPAGVVGNNVYVVVGDKVSFIPTSDLRNTTKETKMEIIGNKVVQDITGSEDITFEQVQTLNEASAATGQDISELLADGGIEGLDEELVAELEAVAADTGIQFENLVAVNQVLETLPEDQVDQLMADIGDMIEEGFAAEIDATLTELSQIEGGIENALNFNSLIECEAAGAANCAETAAAIGANNPEE